MGEEVNRLSLFSGETTRVRKSSTVEGRTSASEGGEGKEGAELFFLAPFSSSTSKTVLSSRACRPCQQRVSQELPRLQLRERV